MSPKRPSAEPSPYDCRAGRHKVITADRICILCGAQGVVDARRLPPAPSPLPQPPEQPILAEFPPTPEERMTDMCRSLAAIMITHPELRQLALAESQADDQMILEALLEVIDELLEGNPDAIREHLQLRAEAAILATAVEHEWPGL